MTGLSGIAIRQLRFAMAVAALALASLLPVVPAASANLIFAVNTVGDASDAAPGDGSCETSPTVRGDSCTLRAAIQETNALPGDDAIRFAIPGTGVHRIAPSTSLPEITDPVEINGYSQPGARPNTNDLSHPDNAALRIELRGKGLGDPESSFGLLVGAGGAGTVIRGLVINDFFTAVVIFAPATVTGSFLGPAPDGTDARANHLGADVVSSTGGVTIGGDEPADRNVISGNKSHGISASRGTRIQGNFIGTQADGDSPLGNGSPAFGGGSGVSFYGPDNVIGGTGGAANVIAFNMSHGIRVSQGGSGRLTRNRIFANGSPGIDLNNDGVTPNDHLDGDTGPNELQNYPILTRAVTGTKGTTIQGILSSSPNDSFNVEFFASPAGTGRQGKRFIGAKGVTTGAGGGATFAFRPLQRVPVGQAITATATKLNGSTSEFSAPRTVTAP